MKKIMIGSIAFVLAIAAISIGLIHSQTQNQSTSILPKDLGKLEYKFNKNEVVVYKMTQDIAVTSEHEYYKNAGGHAVEDWYTIMKVEDVINEQYKFITVGFSDKVGRLAKRNFIIKKDGNSEPTPPAYWLFLNQPRFSKELKEEWEMPIVMVLGLDKTKDPLINVKAKYRVKGVEKLSNIDCFVIESELTANENIDNDGIKELVELQDKAITYFAYKEGRVLKMDLTHHYKITAFEGEKSLVMRDEYATSKYELSDRKFTQVQLDAWLYDKFPDIE